MTWEKIAWLVIIVLLAAFALTYASPAFQRITDVDSAIFQYAGNGIRSGQLPYVDLYDHKPPAVFYINALGLTLGNGSRWGIWGIELLSLIAAGIFCALYLKPFFGSIPAIIATAGFLLNLNFFHEGGNLTEEYALPFEFAALYLLALWTSGKRPRLMVFLMGISIAIASTFKQPLGALGIPIIIFIFISTHKKQGLSHFISTLSWFVLGFFSVWLSWFAFFTLNNALPQFWEAAFAYNFSLANITHGQRLIALRLATDTLFIIAPFFMFALVAWLAAFVFLLITKQKFRELMSKHWLGWLLIGAGLLTVHDNLFIRGFTLFPAQYFSAHHMIQIIFGVILLIFGSYWLTTNISEKIRSYLQNKTYQNHAVLFLPLFIALIDLPIQILMISLSGNNFSHYYMSVLPSITVLCAFFFWSLASNTDRYQAVILTSVLAIPVMVFGINSIVLKTRINENKNTRAVATFIREVTQPDDTVFFWSNNVPAYIESNRLSPSKFYFTDPLFLKEYTGRQHTEPFLEQLQAAPPKIIVVTPNIYHPLIYMDDATKCSELADMDNTLQTAYAQYNTKNINIPEGMPEVYAWICANYTLEEISLPGTDKWYDLVYQYTPNR